MLSETPVGVLVSPTPFYQRALALDCTVTHLDKNRGSYSASLEENPDGAQSVVHRYARIPPGRRSASGSEFLRGSGICLGTLRGGAGGGARVGQVFVFP